MASDKQRPGDYWAQAPEEIRAALERAEAERDEYAEWIAAEDIPVPFGTVLAYRRGSAIPRTNVEQWGYDQDGMGWPERVVAVKRDSKEGKEILAELDARAQTSGDPGAMAAAMREAQAGRGKAVRRGSSAATGEVV